MQPKANWSNLRITREKMLLLHMKHLLSWDCIFLSIFIARCCFPVFFALCLRFYLIKKLFIVSLNLVQNLGEFRHKRREIIVVQFTKYIAPQKDHKALWTVCSYTLLIKILRQVLKNKNAIIYILYYRIFKKVLIRVAKCKKIEMEVRQK